MHQVVVCVGYQQSFLLLPFIARLESEKGKRASVKHACIVWVLWRLCYQTTSGLLDAGAHGACLAAALVHTPRERVALRDLACVYVRDLMCVDMQPMANPSSLHIFGEHCVSSNKFGWVPNSYIVSMFSLKGLSLGVVNEMVGIAASACLHGVVWEIYKVWDRFSALPTQTIDNIGRTSLALVCTHKSDVMYFPCANTILHLLCMSELIYDDLQGDTRTRVAYMAFVWLVSGYWHRGTGNVLYPYVWSGFKPPRRPVVTGIHVPADKHATVCLHVNTAWRRKNILYAMQAPITEAWLATTGDADFHSEPIGPCNDNDNDNCNRTSICVSDLIDSM
jgi:hypothetical protein